MRLLKCTNGRLEMTRDLIKEIPPYAILSHTWSPNEDDEVDYHDMIQGTAATKPGYRKLQFCSQQASADGFEYSWIDTCCINRDSEPQLSQAIRSMFRWYREAAICYVYLADVHEAIDIPAGFDIDALIQSRWFERGWTVQELLAPRNLQFFASSGRNIGDKNQLGSIICQRTGIPPDALRNKSMSSFSIDERLSWFSQRHTKREEDMVYATLGLFDVHMPILYGEGIENARARLFWELHFDRKAYQSSLSYGSAGVIPLPTLWSMKSPSEHWDSIAASIMVMVPALFVFALLLALAILSGTHAVHVIGALTGLVAIAWSLSWMRSRRGRPRRIHIPDGKIDWMIDASRDTRGDRSGTRR